ncbi:MAG: metal-dependent hydrolase [Candidatus Coatesbacteria bacterium]|nr:metal-dependent hydrolase [Candidatus Coatesbacteria bacterium]
MTKIIFNGHANVSIFGNSGCHILIDPFFTGNPSAKIKDISSITPDVIIVTHGHSDHIGDTIKISKQSKSTIVVTNFEIANYLERQGVKVHKLHIGGEVKFPYATIKLIPAIHGSTLPDGSNGGVAAGALVFIDGKVIFHAGDTALTREFRTLGEFYPPDVAIMPVGDTFTMGPKDAGIAAKWLGAKKVIPMHYNTWQPIEQNDAFIRENISKYAEVIFLKPGEEYIL